MHLWQQVHGRLLQLRFLLEATSSALLPAELAALLALAAEGLTQRAHLLGSCRAAVIRAEYLRAASALCATLLLPQAADLAAACQPGDPAGTEDAPWHAPDTSGGACAQHGAADPAAGAASATADAHASSPAFACFAKVLQQGCRRALRLPLRNGCASMGVPEVENSGGCTPDADNPMLSLFLKEAALLLFGPSLSRMLSLGGAGHEGKLSLQERVMFLAGVLAVDPIEVGDCLYVQMAQRLQQRALQRRMWQRPWPTPYMTLEQLH